MVLPASRLVGGNVDVCEPCFSLFKEHVPFLKTDPSGADRLDLGANQHESGLEAVV
jgi:hypothetical protein